MTLAHFTFTELPGTLAILLAGVALGMTLITKRAWLGAAIIAGFIAYALTSMYGDTAGVSVGVKTTLDAIAAALALTLVVGYHRTHRGR